MGLTTHQRKQGINMNIEAMPIMKVEIERLKHSIVSMIGARNSELGDYISAEMDKAINSYDWEGQVKTIVHDVINDRIKSYFSYGDGYHAIKSAIDAGFNVGINND